MSQFVRKIVLVAVVVAVALVMIQGSVPTKAQGKTKIVWFVGLGTGTNDQQVAAQKEVVEDFNKSQDEIELELQLGANFETSRDTIQTMIAAGNSPDIAGPVGVGGSNALADQWLDLKDLIEKNKIDLSAYDPALLDLYKTLNGGYSAIPFGVFPTVVYYNRDAFEEAGIAEPPHKFGEQYEWDGKMVDWNYTTLGEVAKKLTVDKNGNDATSADFDPNNIVQFGLNFQWARLGLILTDLQPEDIYDEAGNKITIPESWRTGAKWLQDALWKDHYLVNATADASTLMQPNAFASGNVAMGIAPLWFTCCMADVADKLNWDMGVVPMSFDGESHVAVDADTFRILKGSKNPEAAFKVLQYLLDTAVPKLAPVYGAFPALEKHQKAWIDSKNETYKQGVDWDVAIQSLTKAVPANMHHEAFTPNWQQGNDRVHSFFTLLFGDAGAKVDVEAELDKLEADFNSIVAGTFPTATPVPPATEEAK
jgi:multiple sugar transport system substrate-binding protein